MDRPGDGATRCYQFPEWISSYFIYFIYSTHLNPVALKAPWHLRKYQSVSFGGSEPLDDVTKLQDIEGMANGKWPGCRPNRLV